jgi:hypothetical protein
MSNTIIMLKFICLIFLFFSHAVHSLPNLVETKDFRSVTPSLPQILSPSSPLRTSPSNNNDEVMDLPSFLIEEPEFVGLNPHERESEKRNAFSLLFPQRYFHKPQRPVSSAYGASSGEIFSSPSSFKRISSTSTNSAFVPWAGKRSGFMSPSTPSFFPFEGKRFQAWAGKRAGTFRNWGGKRSDANQPESVLT